MANYKVISDIGKTVINMLKDNLVPNLIDNSDDIGICDLKSRKDFVVGLHLYDIIEKRDTPKGAFVDLRDGRRSNPPTEYKLCYMISISSKQDISNKRISMRLEEKMNKRQTQVIDKAENFEFLENYTIPKSAIIKPINVMGDISGSVIVLSDNITDVEKSLAEFGGMFMGRYLEG